MKITIVGAFFFDTLDTGGQPVKTRFLYDALCSKYGNDNVSFIETVGWKKHPFALFRECFKKAKQSDVIIMLPANNGLKIFAPLLRHFKRKYSKKIFYDVIGGWLPDFISDKPRLTEKLKDFDGIWVETSTMKSKLEDMGFNNVLVIPNFKMIKPLEEAEIVFPSGNPLKLCTFSRVMKEKGIEDAVNSVKAVNEKLGYTALSLDIYGQIDIEQVEWFDNLKKIFPEYIEYKGVIKPEESVDTVKNYSALLFPTRFYTEGIPGTIIDAYAAGVPVISAKWLSVADVIDDGKTGVCYEFGNADELFKLLLSLAKNPEVLNKLKVNCIEKAKQFSPEYALELISKQL